MNRRVTIKRPWPVVIQAIFLVLAMAVVAQAADGTYDATVTTDSGSYTVPVTVEGDEVTYVHWPNGGDMHVYGANIVDGTAQGTNSRDESVSIEMVDQYEPSGDQ